MNERCRGVVRRDRQNKRVAPRGGARPSRADEGGLLLNEDGLSERTQSRAAASDCIRIDLLNEARRDVVARLSIAQVAAGLNVHLSKGLDGHGLAASYTAVGVKVDRRDGDHAGVVRGNRARRISAGVGDGGARTETGVEGRFDWTLAVTAGLWSDVFADGVSPGHTVGDRSAHPLRAASL